MMTTTKRGKDVEQLELLFFAGKDGIDTSIWKTHKRFLSKLKNTLTRRHNNHVL